MRALEFGLAVERPGYNIFVSGKAGTGKSTVIRSHLEAAIKQDTNHAKGHHVYDWCYVFNFEDHDSPRVIRLEPGMGKQFVRDIAELQSNLSHAISTAFDDDAYKNEVRRINDEASQSRNVQIAEAERAALAKNFSVQVGSMGIAVVPLKDGKPLERNEFVAMSKQQQEEIDTAQREVAERIETVVGRLRTLEENRLEAIHGIDGKVVENVVKPPFAVLENKYRDVDTIQQFLAGLREFSLTEVQILQAAETQDEQARPTIPGDQAAMPQAGLLPFRVNLFVDNSAIDRKQIIVEDNPTFPHLFGNIERTPVPGAALTNHMMLKAGSLVRASGGFLVLEARDVLTHPAVWPALKRVLKGGEVRPEDPSDLAILGLFPQGLRPDAIPIDVKVVMTGEPEVYSLLVAHDPEFWEIFKIRADLDHQTANTASRILEYSRFITDLCNKRELRHFTKTGIASVVEHGARMVESQKKLSTRFGLLADLVVEASEYAARSDSDLVGREHVEEALEQRVYRAARVADAIQGLMIDGTLIVDLEGKKVGQANGLAVYGDGDLMFGKPNKITIRTYMGQQGVINIEREVRLGGAIHNKGVLILTGYLGATFAQKFPLSVNISIAFEQSYGPVDGDSASSTELYAILSSLADVPIRQDIAITGSVNQAGDIQPIGGVNEKVEGFFDLCKAAGKLGSAGILIPRLNVKNLMLRRDVVEAAGKGEFHIYSAASVLEGIEILTGLEAGEPDENGHYPADSVNGRAEAKLRAYADGLRGYYLRHDGRDNGV